MENTLIVGDLHLNYIAPRSRIDDYSHTLINALDNLRIYATNNNISNIIFLGDIFHKPYQSLEYLIEILSLFRRFESSNITCYSIIGNHDIQYTNTTNIKKSALGILFKSNLLKHLTEIDFTNNGTTYHIQGLDYGLPIPEIKPDVVNILVAHMYYEFPLSESYENLTKKQLEESKYNYIFLGHDHTPHEDITLNNTTLIRPGAFTRVSAKDYTLKRNAINLELVKFDKELTHERIEFPLLPIEDIFSSEVTNPNVKDFISTINNKFESLIEMMSVEHESTSVYSVLKDMVLEDKVRSKIIFYLEQRGIYDNKEKVV